MILASQPGLVIGGQVSGDGCSSICIIELGFDCIGEPSVCTALCGNLDGDFDVDDDDFAIFLASYGRATDDSRFNPDADFDGDGVVTLVDFQQWLACYRAFVGNPVAAPASAGMLGDLDADFDIDMADFADFQMCMSDPPEFRFSCVLKFDFNGDSFVDFDDYAPFASLLEGPQ